ncbi:MAG: endonuclease/exonuclease/phosphatase family protein [Candidatus Eremiobacteraeota bacterium]|nr:endonuclease/exonuclease/phosphatase family protein [Candidatus Eremiobacteraeota bacterium]MCW5871140.1 endonuclease/exonuclease/phosphatase family protein [Candidatus Eremiobacteraeota bacterium]
MKWLMRIMTYNIRAGRGLDGRLSLNRIAQVIQAESPDVVALQEVDSQRKRSTYEDQAHVLADRLGYHCAFVHARRWTRGEYGNAILSRFPLLDFQRLALPKPARLPVEARCVLQCRLAHPDGDVHVWNTHLGLLAAERRAQVAVMIQEYLRHQELPLILCGDFNARPRSKEISGLGLHLQRVLSHRTFPGFLPVVHLDHVFHTKHLRVDRTFVPKTLLARRASDHLPLVVDLQWLKKPAPRLEARQILNLDR